MHLDDYLVRHATDRGAFCQALAERLGAAPACLAGSLIEGIGNMRSDVDVYVLGAPADAAALTFGSARIDLIGSIVVDIEYVDPGRLDTLLDRLAAFPAEQGRDPRRSAVALSMGEIKLLHNLSIGQALDAQAPLPAAGRIDRTALARVLFDFHVVSLRVMQEDVVGFLEANDEESANALLRSYRQQLGGALLAALGQTNPAEKWRAAKLRQAEREHASVLLPGGRTLAQAVQEWRALDQAIGQAAALDTYGRLTSLGNAICPWGLQRFTASASAPPPSPQAAERGPAERGPAERGPAVPSAYRNRLPALAHDCVIRCDEAGVSIGRMGSDQRIYVNQLGHETLLQFDGRTVVGQALAHLRRLSDAPSEDLERSLSNFHHLLLAEQLI